MSGSFIVSGQCHARLDRVGEDSYISKLTMQAKEMQSGEQSEMIRSLNKLVKCVGVAIIPIGLVLFSQAFFIQHDGFREERDIHDCRCDRYDTRKVFTCLPVLLLRSVPSGLRRRKFSCMT